MQDITQRCIESISKNSHLRNALQTGTDQQQRNILTAWYEGFATASGNQPTVSVDEFSKQVLPEVRKAA